MVDQPATFVSGPTKGSKYSSRYLVDENNYLYKRKVKKNDGAWGRHLWICIEKACTASASTFSKEGVEAVRIVAFGSKQHEHVSDHSKVITETMIMLSSNNAGDAGRCLFRSLS